jgi:protocatechuate 3,4-dioxygenase beta subunit
MPAIAERLGSDLTERSAIAMTHGLHDAIAIAFITVLLLVSVDSTQKFTQPPGEETEQIKTLIAKAEARLRSGTSTTDILRDPAYLPAHEWPRFRTLIRRHATTSRLVIVCPGEEGDPLMVTGKVIDRAGNALAGAILYAYQTSAKGWYSDRAAHIAAHEGDRKHARLFGYLRTDESGRFELKTIRPVGYPDSDLPAHIHIEVRRDDDPQVNLTTEIQFDDDPRLTPAMRARSRREGFVIGVVRTEPDRPNRVEVELKTR